MKRLWTVGLTALGVMAPSLGTGIAGASSQVPPSTLVVGSSPRIPSGALPTSAALPGSLTVSVALRPADPAGLQAYASAASTPGNPDYRHFLTPDEIDAQYGPAISTVDAVRSWLASEGLVVHPTSGDGTVIPATGSPAQLATAFDTSFKSYRLSSGTVRYANRSAARLPATLAAQVEGVIGLDDLSLPPSEGSGIGTGTGSPSAAPPSPKVERSATTAGPQPCAAATAAAAGSPLPGPGGTGYPATANQIAAGLGFTPLYAEGDLGQGTTVAVVLPGSDYLDSDITLFEQCYGIKTSVSRVAVDGGPGVPPGGGGALEMELDIEAVAAFAPSANILVYEAPFSDAGFLDSYAAMAQDDRADVGTISAGTCEILNTSTYAENTIFEEMAAQGQSMFASSGDAGSEACLPFQSELSSASATSLAVQDPASQPFVTSVGGAFIPDLSQSHKVSVWNDGPQTSASGVDASGGGYSMNWTMPSWQNGADDSGNNPDVCGASGATACRAVPDVSGQADPRNSLLIYCTPCSFRAADPRYPNWVFSFGTSFASPTWAAFAALIDEGIPGGRAGLLSPALYQVDRSDPSAFIDVTSGNNNALTRNNSYVATGGSGNYTCGGTHTESCYQATPGYDTASGLGIPVGNVLAADIESLNSGDGTYFGSMGGSHLNAPVVGMAATPDGQGYWLAASDGGIFSFGDAKFDGSMGGSHLNAPVVGMAATPDGQGYWLVASDGGTFSFGDAAFYGSTGDLILNQPIVGMAATPDGQGYWLVASDGGIFSFGDAKFDGSMGGSHLNAPVVGMASTPDGQGYWLVASDGGTFSFGDAGFYGSMGGTHLNAPIMGMAATSDGQGYWMVASDGGLFSFGDAAFHGSMGGMGLNKPIVGMASLPNSHGYWLVAADGGIFSFELTPLAQVRPCVAADAPARVRRSESAAPSA